MTVALIPVKRLEESKSRLLPELPDARRQALTLAMLEDLIESLSETRPVDRIAVTTPDPLVAERASAAGAEILMREEPGLNAALEDGRERLKIDAGDGFLIVLGDVAGALPTDFERLIEAGHADARPGVWLAPSSDGGTSALLQIPANTIACSFGRNSAARHREAATAVGVAYHEVELESLLIDLDQPEDLEAFLKSDTGGRRTRALLESAERKNPE
ncbi:MAG: 2-phospho-L-lactate guanylyltransferase [Myxococcales bacterium]|nr:2-phospho-L-lactate guanylyltransferase [Myxococcales bacterium]HIK84850.1 2-phospho-L-lactate guanylyltransferase [Myxococcales bacterium]